MSLGVVTEEEKDIWRPSKGEETKTKFFLNAHSSTVIQINTTVYNICHTTIKFTCRLFREVGRLNNLELGESRDSRVVYKSWRSDIFTEVTFGGGDIFTEGKISWSVYSLSWAKQTLVDKKSSSILNHGSITEVVGWSWNNTHFNTKWVLAF